MSATTFIYCLFNAEGIIDYIGKSNNPKKRFRQHGRRGFVIAAAPFLGWKRYEAFFITQFLELGGTLRNKNLGGGGLTKHSPETCAKISASHMGKPQTLEHTAKSAASRTGLKHSPEHRANIGNAHKGMKRPPRSPEHLANLGVALKGKTPWNKGRHTGKKHSPEHRAKISAGCKGKIPWNKGNRKYGTT